MTAGERLRLVRQAINADPDDLADAIGITRADLAALEAADLPPEDDALVDAIADVTGMDMRYFYKDIPIVNITPASPTVADLDDYTLLTLLAQTRLWLDRYLDLESFLEAEEVPSFALPEGFPVTVDSHREAARAAENLRVAWGLGDLPIANLSELLIDRGIRVGLVNVGGDFEAASFRTDDVFGWPLIVVQEGLAGEWAREAIAKELSYFMLANPSVEYEPHFAAAFLLPAHALIRELGTPRQDIDPIELASLKQKYGIRVHDLLIRAATLRVIDRETLDAIIENGRNSGGWTEIEQEMGLLPPEAPGRMDRLAARGLAEELIDEDRASEITNLPWLET